MNSNYYNNLPNFQNSLDFKNQDCMDTTNVFKFNIGKKVVVYLTFPDSTEWRDLSIDGIIEQCGKDYLIISDPTSGKWHMIFNKYINYISFEERVNYTNKFI